ncbi:hypothetical protein MGN01_15010 [Methylobacterium gnaphalii]|uniref:Uncharacterized protein n=1 Tax=Methylobacterium gnaphalii TaxID=1010610 RepID=A0A512JI87_9HYPH|nr:hypothetical protein MGN01_15010 [Methylobacterium gnaphalii]
MSRDVASVRDERSVEGDGDEGEEAGEGQVAGEDENDDRHEIGRFAKESGAGCVAGRAASGCHARASRSRKPVLVLGAMQRGHGIRRALTTLDRQSLPGAEYFCDPARFVAQSLQLR